MYENKIVSSNKHSKCIHMLLLHKELHQTWGNVLIVVTLLIANYF